MPWELTGNAGTNPNPPANDFVGTTDSQPLAFKTHNVERVRIDTNGNVGIGTTAPANTLHTRSTANNAPRLVLDYANVANSNSGVQFNESGTFKGGMFMSQDSSALSLWSGGSNRVKISASGNVEISGNVGIGTASPVSNLEAQISAPGALGPVLTLTNFGGGAGAAAALDFNVTPLPVIPGGPLPLPFPGAKYQPSTRIMAINRDEGQDIVFLGVGPASAATASVGTGTPTAPVLHPGPIVPPQIPLTERMRITPNGVGIGPGAPGSDFAVGNGLTINGSAETQLYVQKNGATGLALNTNQATPGDWAMYDKVGGRWNLSLVSKGGDIGVGTYTPASKLHVNGDITVTGDVLLTAGAADCAEQFDACSSELLEPGTVVVIGEDGALGETRHPYDKKVAGVVSGAGEYRHGLVLDRRPSEEGRITVALLGKVFCKVDAAHSPIEVGDLLTTSATPGHAMKATDQTKAFGSIIGKALKPLERGRGLIPILIALQ